jgi:hypothetical protein
MLTTQCWGDGGQIFFSRWMQRRGSGRAAAERVDGPQGHRVAAPLRPIFQHLRPGVDPFIIIHLETP